MMFLDLQVFHSESQEGWIFVEIIFQEEMPKTLKMLAEKVLKMQEYSRIGIPGSFTSY